jgi:hypothetical protein
LTPLAVPATHPGIDTAALFLAALVVTACYLGACAIWPFGACGRCDGNGKIRSPSGRAWRPCPRCKGSGGRLRLGRHVWNHLRARRDDARR